ncbi:MAG TPA: hypothetical protein VGF43_23050 [Dongiaceae bacterium]|jgi:hypothetical protein
MRTHLIAAGFVLVLGSCTSQQGQTLEARAKAGDPASACQLVIEDLQACLDARTKWLDHPKSARPDCQKDAIPDTHHAYLVGAAESLARDPKREEAGKLVLDGTSVVETALLVDATIPGTSLFQQQFGQLMNALRDYCPKLAP